jgi:hypothetical protein
MKTSAKKMRHSSNLITLLALTFSIKGFAQDTIMMRNGQSIIGQVMEISITEVKYKKAGIADGPVYVEDRAGVERIKYKNGFSDVFPEIKPWQLPVAKIEKQEPSMNPKLKPMLEKRGGKYLYDHERLSENQLYRLLLTVNDPEISYQVKMAKRDKGFQYIGFAAAPLGMLSIFSMMAAADVHPLGNSNTPEKNASKLFIGCAAACVVSSIYFKINRKHRSAEAVRLYKQKFE